MANPQYSSSPKFVNQIITIRGRAYAVRYQGQRVSIYNVRSGWRHFNSNSDFKAWRTNAMIAFRELDARYGGEAA